MPSYPKFKTPPVAFNQRQLFATNVFDLLPESHDCVVYEQIFRELDIS
jgi:hypothetical protein